MIVGFYASLPKTNYARATLIFAIITLFTWLIYLMAISANADRLFDNGYNAFLKHDLQQSEMYWQECLNTQKRVPWSGIKLARTANNLGAIISLRSDDRTSSDLLLNQSVKLAIAHKPALQKFGTAPSLGILRELLLASGHATEANDIPSKTIILWGGPNHRFRIRGVAGMDPKLSSSLKLALMYPQFSSQTILDEIQLSDQILLAHSVDTDSQSKLSRLCRDFNAALVSKNKQDHSSRQSIEAIRSIVCTPVSNL